MSVILHVNKTHSLVNVFFLNHPSTPTIWRSGSATVLCSSYPLTLHLDCQVPIWHTHEKNYTFGSSRKWQAYNNQMNIISTQKFYLHENPFTCYLKRAKLAICCTLIMQINDMWNLQVPQNDVTVSALWGLKCGNLVAKVLKEMYILFRFHSTLYCVNIFVVLEDVCFETRWVILPIGYNYSS